MGVPGMSTPVPVLLRAAISGYSSIGLCITDGPKSRGRQRLEDGLTWEGKRDLQEAKAS